MRDSSHALTRRRLLAGTALALLTVFAPACGSSKGGTPTTPIVTSVAGTWNLSTVNGVKVPFTIQAADPREELLTKQYVFTAGGTFTYSYSLRYTELDGRVNNTSGSDAGTYTLADNYVTIRNASDGSTLFAAITPETMTIVSGAFTQVFTK